MAKNFTLDRYEEFLKSICNKKSRIITVRKYFNNKLPSKQWMIIRHDIDRRPECALKMAKLERQYEIFTTYYFRVPFNIKILNKIGAMGHEIGFHYEKNKKWPVNMPKLFTCSPHMGSEYKPDHLYDAKDIIAGRYITDTGRGNPKYNIKDHVNTDNSENIYLNIHPERWNNGIMWYYQYLFDFICNKLKEIIYESSFD